jgi:osmotically-inducible protein OsmY
MNSKKIFATVLFCALTWLVGCSSNRNTASNGTNPDRDTKTAVEKSLDQAGYSGVRVDYDRDNRVITLNGRVRSPELKARASEVAQAAAQGEVVANQLSVEPVDKESAAKKIEGNVDDAIEKNYKASLIANQLDKERIHFKAKNGVLTLNGKVKTAEQRAEAEKIAASVPNVQQVVNKLNVEAKGVQQAAEPR